MIKEAIKNNWDLSLHEKKMKKKEKKNIDQIKMIKEKIKNDCGLSLRQERKKHERKTNNEDERK